MIRDKRWEDVYAWIKPVSYVGEDEVIEMTEIHIAVYIGTSVFENTQRMLEFEYDALPPDAVQWVLDQMVDFIDGYMEEEAREGTLGTFKGVSSLRSE
jgi:hypothetical protein